LIDRLVALAMRSQPVVTVQFNRDSIGGTVTIGGESTALGR
jgi:hypothetical protein